MDKKQPKQLHYVGAWGQSLSRRELIAAMGGVIAIGGILTACSGGSDSGSSGGTLVGVMTQQIPSSLDPITNAQGAALNAASPCHDWLEFVAINGDLYPSLAESVEQPDPQTIVYQIRSGVNFQNGEPVNAQAIVDLIAWIQDKNNGAWLNSRFEGVEAVAVDELTLQLNLPKADVTFRFAVTRLPIVAVATMADQALNPSGCGPYKFKEWVQGSYVEYSKDPNYREADRITLDTIRMEHFNDSNAGTQAFLAGGKNWVYPTSLSQAKDLTARADARN